MIGRQIPLMTSQAIHVCRNDYSDVETMIFIEIRITLVGQVSFSWQPPRQCYSVCCDLVWRHCDITGQLNMVKELLEIILCDASWPLFEFSQFDRWFVRFIQAVLWLVNIDPSYDVTGLRNMFNWPLLGRFYDIYVCLTPFYNAGLFYVTVCYCKSIHFDLVWPSCDVTGQKIKST